MNIIKDYMWKGWAKIFTCAMEERGRFVLPGVLILLLCAGGVYAYFLGSTLRYWDEKHYLLLAQHLHEGIYSFDGVVPTAFQPPGYPIALYLLSFLSTDLMFLRFANYIFFCLSVIFLYWMLKKEEGSLAAFLGVLMAGTYPLFFYSAGTFYPQTIASSFFLLSLALISSQKIPNWKKELVIGITLGVLVLIVPAFLLYLPLWCAYPWFMQSCKRWRAVLLLLVGCFSLVGCWTVRNAITFERLVLVSSNSGINLLLGNSEYTTPEAGVNVDVSRYLSAGGKMGEFDQDSYYTQEAVKWVADNPWKAFKLYLLKSLNFFNFKNELASWSEKSMFKDVFSFISYYPVLILALGRFFFLRVRPLKPFEWFLALFFMCSPFLQAIFFTRIRFRIPLDFIAIYFAAACLQSLLEKATGPLWKGRVK